MSPVEPACLVDCRAVLGEGPVWVVAEQALYWIDIKGRRVFRRDVAGHVDSWPTPMRVGSLAPCTCGGFIAGTEHGIAFIDPVAGRYDAPMDPEPELAHHRFNDGKVDRMGRFWAGTMDDLERDATGALYRVDSGPAPMTVVSARVDAGYRVTNGPAFGRDGRIMYHADSAMRIIYAFDLDRHGNATNKRVFARFVPADGFPDGMTVDAEDALWVAFWDGWCIRRFSAAGELLAEFPLPVERPTSLAFGGPALDQLYITSARIGFDAEALAAQPYAGGLFMLVPGVTGLAERPFEGTSHR